MKLKISNIAITVFAYAATCAGAALATSNSVAGDYQMNALFQPSEHQLKRESRGFVYIYDGLTDRMVNKAMDENPDRIESMMFVNTKITDVNGNVARHPKTGEILREDDGC